MEMLSPTALRAVLLGIAVLLWTPNASAQMAEARRSLADTSLNSANILDDEAFFRQLRNADIVLARKLYDSKMIVRDLDRL